MVNVIGFLSGLDTQNGTGQFYFLCRLATEPNYFSWLLRQHPEQIIELCTFPTEPTEELSVDMSKRLLNLATLIFHRLGINYKDAQFIRKPDMPLFTSDTTLIAPAFKLGMELVRTLCKAHFYLLAVSYYNFLRNRIESCSATYRELFSQCSRRVFPALLEHYTNNEQSFTERYYRNDPNKLLPGLTEPLGPEGIQTLLNKEAKEGKTVRTLCLHGIQRSIPKSDAEGKPLCHLSGYLEFRDRRCKC